jgi:hypothetical protein
MYRMQARSSTSGLLVMWETTEPDFAGASFPGPGTPLHIAIANVFGNEGGSGGAAAPAGSENDVVGLNGAGGFKALGQPLSLPDGGPYGWIPASDGAGGLMWLNPATLGGGSAFDMASMNLSLWLEGPFNGTIPFMTKASSGISGTVQLEVVTGDGETGPTVGTTYGGKASYAFSGTKLLRALGKASLIMPATGYSFAGMLKMNTVAAAAAHTYADPALICDVAGLDIGVTDGGLGIAQYPADASGWLEQRVPYTTDDGALHYFKGRFSSTAGIEIGVDNGGLTPVTGSNKDRNINAYYDLVIGQAIIAGGGTLLCDLVGLAITPDYWTPTEFTNIRTRWLGLFAP